MVLRSVGAFLLFCAGGSVRRPLRSTDGTSAFGQLLASSHGDGIMHGKWQVKLKLKREQGGGSGIDTFCCGLAASDDQG